MSALDVGDPAALEAALDALPLGTWVEVTTEGERFLLERVPGGLVALGDGITLHPGDVADGRPTRVEVLGADDHLPPREAVAAARAAFEAGDRDEAEAALAELDDLDSAGWAEAGALRDRIAAWLQRPASDTDEEALALLADLDPDEAADLERRKRSEQ